MSSPQPPRPTSRYLLPDGRIVRIFDDVGRGDEFVSFTLENGKVVTAVKMSERKDDKG